CQPRVVEQQRAGVAHRVHQDEFGGAVQELVSVPEPVPVAQPLGLDSVARDQVLRVPAQESLGTPVVYTRRLRGRLRRRQCDQGEQRAEPAQARDTASHSIEHIDVAGEGFSWSWTFSYAAGTACL